MEEIITKRRSAQLVVWRVKPLKFKLEHSLNTCPNSEIDVSKKSTKKNSNYKFCSQKGMLSFEKKIRIATGYPLGYKKNLKNIEFKEIKRLEWKKSDLCVIKGKKMRWICLKNHHV